MNPKSTSPTTVQERDLEAQVEPHDEGKGSDASSLHIENPPKAMPSRTSTEAKEPSVSLPQNLHISQDDRSGEGAAGETKDSTKPQPSWKPWKLDEPYRTEVPKDEEAMEKWVKAMKESDDGMCKGWKDQIDTLIIFAGLFSATVTAFTVESYQWLEETPADMLARLQLRALLNGTGNSAATVDRLAPSTFNVSPSSVLINTLWFASLTLALAAVVVSILCKQWLHEYQRYDNFTTEESFLIHGLRYRGLQAWRVPLIIASLPILLQTALVLFLIGLLVLLWPFQTIVASISIVIVGLTFLFLGITTILPAVQYIYPKFDTQCAYKSSQSWTFFVISAFWLFDFSMFTNWATFDRWEVTCISNGTGHTLARVYELVSNNADAFRNIYNFLADTSLQPKIKADLILLSDFVGGLGASRRATIIEVVSQTTNTNNIFHRFAQLQNYISLFRRHRISLGRVKPPFTKFWRSLPFKDFKKFQGGFMECDTPGHVYHLQTQKIFSQFLRSDIHYTEPEIHNRYIEHLFRWTDASSDDMDLGNQAPQGFSEAQGQQRETFYHYWNLGEYLRYNPVIAPHLVEILSYILQTDQISKLTGYTVLKTYASLMESYRQHNFNPPPFGLLKEIQEWIGQTPESDLAKKVDNAGDVLSTLGYRFKDIFPDPSRASDLEKPYLRSFAQFSVDFYEREGVSDGVRKLCIGDDYMVQAINQGLERLRDYLAHNSPTSS